MEKNEGFASLEATTDIPASFDAINDGSLLVRVVWVPSVNVSDPTSPARIIRDDGATKGNTVQSPRFNSQLPPEPDACAVESSELEPATLSRENGGVHVLVPFASKDFSGGFTLWHMEVGDGESGIENGSSAAAGLGGNMESGRGRRNEDLGYLEGRCQQKWTTIAAETALRIMAPKVTPTSTAIVVLSLSTVYEEDRVINLLRGTCEQGDPQGEGKLFTGSHCGPSGHLTNTTVLNVFNCCEHWSRR